MCTPHAPLPEGSTSIKITSIDLGLLLVIELSHSLLALSTQQQSKGLNQALGKTAAIRHWVVSMLSLPVGLDHCANCLNLEESTSFNGIWHSVQAVHQLRNMSNPTRHTCYIIYHIMQLCTYMRILNSIRLSLARMQSELRTEVKEGKEWQSSCGMSIYMSWPSETLDSCGNLRLWYGCTSIEELKTHQNVQRSYCTLQFPNAKFLLRARKLLFSRWSSIWVFGDGRWKPWFKESPQSIYNTSKCT